VDTGLAVLQLRRGDTTGSNLSVHTDERVVEEAWLVDRLAGDPLTDVRLSLLFL
jgi:hypothetical protein